MYINKEKIILSELIKTIDIEMNELYELAKQCAKEKKDMALLDSLNDQIKTFAKVISIVRILSLKISL